MINYMLNGKATIVLLTIGLIKKASINERIFSKPKPLRRKVKVELDLYNYATKADLKNLTGAETSKFAKMVDLANIKSNKDKLDIDRQIKW